AHARAYCPRAGARFATRATAAGPGATAASTTGQEFVIGASTPGTPSDAVIVGYYQAGKFLYAGKVRAGFVPHVRREIMEKMEPLKTEACPFANLPEKKRTQWALTKEEMKDCQWLNPKLVAQIEFTEWTP